MSAFLLLNNLSLTSAVIFVCRTISVLSEFLLSFQCRKQLNVTGSSKLVGVDGAD